VDRLWHIRPRRSYPNEAQGSWWSASGTHQEISKSALLGARLSADGSVSSYEKFYSRDPSPSSSGCWTVKNNDSYISCRTSLSSQEPCTPSPSCKEYRINGKIKGSREKLAKDTSASARGCRIVVDSSALDACERLHPPSVRLHNASPTWSDDTSYGEESCVLFRPRHSSRDSSPCASDSGLARRRDCEAGAQFQRRRAHSCGHTQRRWNRTSSRKKSCTEETTTTLCLSTSRLQYPCNAVGRVDDAALRERTRASSWQAGLSSDHQSTHASGCRRNSAESKHRTIQNYFPDLSFTNKENFTRSFGLGKLHADTNPSFPCSTGLTYIEGRIGRSDSCQGQILNPRDLAHYQSLLRDCVTAGAAVEGPQVLSFGGMKGFSVGVSN
jgi:hypothetical protein